MDIVTSVHGVPIRLTDERRTHILKNHPELEPHRAWVLDAIREPHVVLRAGENALCAVRKLTEELHIVVIYREVSQQDGFVITSWLTSRMERLLRRQVVWRRPPSSL